MSPRPNRAVTSTVRVNVLPDPALALTTSDWSRMRGSLRSRVRMSVPLPIGLDGHIHGPSAEGRQLTLAAMLAGRGWEIPRLQPRIEAGEDRQQPLTPGSVGSSLAQGGEVLGKGLWLLVTQGEEHRRGPFARVDLLREEHVERGLEVGREGSLVLGVGLEIGLLRGLVVHHPQ